MSATNRLLITKLVLTSENRVDLFAKGHRYKDLTLFDVSDLAEAGVDYANLTPGQEIPCRFWAYYELSEKTNQAGNPYKDIVKLEPFDAPASSASTDTSAIVDELRAVRALLQILVDQTAPVRAPDTDEFNRLFPRDENGQPTEPPPDASLIVIPAGEHAGQTLGWLADHDLAYLQRIATVANGVDMRQAAQIVIDWHESQPRKETP